MATFMYLCKLEAVNNYADLNDAYGLCITAINSYRTAIDECYRHNKRDGILLKEAVSAIKRDGQAGPLFAKVDRNLATIGDILLSLAYASCVLDAWFGRPQRLYRAQNRCLVAFETLLLRLWNASRQDKSNRSIEEAKAFATTKELPSVNSKPKRRKRRVVANSSQDKKRCRRACVSCNMRKVRCSGGELPCTRCIRNGQGDDCKAFIPSTSNKTKVLRPILVGEDGKKIKRLADKHNLNRGKCYRNNRCTRPNKHPGHCSKNSR